MEIRNFVQSNAQVTRVMSLSPGDFYQRLDAASYGGPRMRVGVVTGVHANGDQAAVTAIEFATEYGDGKPALKVFAGDSDVALFPLASAELGQHLSQAIKMAGDEVGRLVRELEGARDTMRTLEALWERRAALTPAPSGPVELE